MPILLPLLVLTVSLAGAATATWFTTRHNRAVAADRLTVHAGELTEDLRQRLTLYRYGLHAAQGALVVAGPEALTAERFRRYSETWSLETEYPGALGFGLIRRVAAVDEAAFVEAERRNGRPGFQVRQLAPHDGERAIIQFIEPDADNAAALGLDIASEPARRAAARDAMLSGEPRLTAPVTLVQKTDGRTPGFLLLLPIYRRGAETTTPAEREAAALGWSYVPFAIDRMLADSELMRPDIGFTLSDVTDAADPAPFYSSPEEAGVLIQGLAREETLSLFGRLWLVRFHATPVFLRSLNLMPPWVPAARLLVGGVLLALLLRLHLMNLARHLEASREKANQADILEAEVKTRTAELAEREARFKTLTELSTDWYWETDADGRFTAISQGVARLGLDQTAVIGKTRRALAADPDDPRLDEYEGHIRNGRPFRDLGYDLMGHDGRLRHIVISGAPVVDPGGACVGFRGSGRDVTEQLRAQDALRASQRFIRAVADDIPGLVGYWDAEERCRFANRRYLEYFGRPAEEVMGRSLRSLLGEEMYGANLPHIEAALRGETQRFERAMIKADGSHSDIWINYMPDIDHGGHVQGFCVLATDVTPLKRAERELRATSSRLALATQASGIAIWEYDVNTARMAWDEQMFRLYGARPGDTEVFAVWRAQCVPEDQPRVQSEFRRVARGEGDLDIEFRIRHPDGGLRQVKAASITERDADGRPLRIIGVNWDVTEMRGREAALVAAQAAAEGASRAKTDFLANMSHEIRTPMNAILGLTQLMAGSELSDQQRDFVTKIATAGRGLLALINDILDFSKVEAGRMELENAEFHLPGLLDGMVSLMQVNASERGLRLTAKVLPGTPAAVIGDHLRLQQVLLNLLGNALKFTHSGGVALRVRQDGWHADGRALLRFSVADTGIGIADDAIPALFSAFTQADSSTTRRYGGTGLGLAICKRLVTLMGGEIGAESRPGQGSTFWFTVPVEVATSATPPAQDPPPTPPAKKRPGAKRLDDVRVLIVEDNAINQDVSTLILQSEGASVTLAADGRQALELLGAEPPPVDIVLMDMQMPVMDGYEATRQIRQNLGLRTLPVVALTAGVLDAERRRAYTAGITDFMTKPFDIDQMVATIRRYVPVPAEHETHPPRSPVDIDSFRDVVPGIDGRLAALGVNGDRALFDTMLHRFVVEFSGAAPRIRQAVESEKPEDAAHSLHTLRGTAAQLAATEVAAAAGVAEQALRRKDWVAWDADMATLTTALDALTRVVLADGPPPAPHPVGEPLDRAALPG
ncbi:CHASE domain-containing protein [Nitrospirillum iridis]|uniref:Sensory/regulatory protein RpfC n=1 Tax=Nitrospirillum iridis TaxID=765888 RepID=A0A7X0AU73_9PROT|nr:CHASE domain-containing protein [Nitrospirillum iridis]MBB6250189.1 PAS domain S-box-containing protein [Nitrospirillum iridis]